MSNLAVHTLYSILNSRKDCICERSFCEEPLLGLSLESGSRLETFQVIAFSISFESDYPNVLRTLLAARIPLRTADRNGTHPLILAGGACVFSNPEPLADCIDLYAVGEGEEVVNEILDAFSETHARGLSRTSLLRAFSEIPGVYVPSLYKPVYSDDGNLTAMEAEHESGLPVASRIVPDLDRHPCTSVIVTPETEFANMFLTEIGRGCRRGCRFCSACHTYLKRNRSLDSIKKQILSARALSDRIGLVTSDFAGYPGRNELLDFLLNNRFGFSVSSVRADAITKDLLAGMKASAQRTLTLAPEVASGKLASLIGKNITTEALFKAIDMALNQHIANFRLYFMIGFPGEENEDVEAIAELVRGARALMRRSARTIRKMGRLTISVNPFVPKPFTPLESAPFADSVVLSERVGILRQALGRIPNTSLLVQSPRMSALQCAFARGDRRVGHLAEIIARGQTTAQAMRAFGGEIERYTSAQPEGVGMRPWHTIQPPAAHGKKAGRKGTK
jgi:radical SAM superfamily enzyme YgiQ (UPF0313 family)